jgi:hypothetical protein
MEKQENDFFAESMNKMLDDANALAEQMSKLMENRPASTGAVAVMFLFERLKELSPDIVEICSHVYRQSKINGEIQAAEKAALATGPDQPTVQ